MVTLSGQESKQFRIALCSAFPTRNKLKMMLREELDLRLDEISDQGNLTDDTAAVIAHAEETGITRSLIEAASRANQGNPSLKAFIARYKVAPQRAVEQRGANLEKIVRPNLSYKSPRLWRDRLEQLERTVCRIERGGEAVGTGFLVAPDILLTNYHVMMAAIPSGSASTYRARFDYQLGLDGVPDDGCVVAFHEKWNLGSSPFHPADTKPLPKNTEPDTDHLDYAFIRLASAIGDEVIDEVGETKIARGFVPLAGKAGKLDVGSPLFILQHPAGSPLRLALDTDAILTINAPRTRVRYKTNTEPGSSGSPCFDADWNLVALHHSGDPRETMTPAYNEGIPIDTLRAALPAELAKMLGLT